MTHYKALTKASALRASLRRIKRFLFWKVIFFEMEPDPKKAPPPSMRDVSFAICNNLDSFLEVVNFRKEESLRVYQERFKETSYFVYLADQNGIVCSGWVSKPRDRFYINEKGIHKRVGGRCVLFDFKTIPTKRCRGYYKHLLQIVCYLWRFQPLLIYTTSDNGASLTGIQSAGFRRL